MSKCRRLLRCRLLCNAFAKKCAESRSSDGSSSHEPSRFRHWRAYGVAVIAPGRSGAFSRHQYDYQCMALSLLLSVVVLLNVLAA